MSFKTSSVVPAVLAGTMLGRGFAVISIFLSFAIAEGLRRGAVLDDMILLKM